MKTLARQSTHNIYVYCVYVILLGFLAAMLFFIIADFRVERIFITVASSVGIIYSLYYWTERIRKMPLVKSLKYDNANFYVALKDMEIIIPFEDTKGIEILTIGGVFELELINPSQLGDKILFKPSLAYPLGFEKTDKQIAAINSRIKRLQKQKKSELKVNQLNSLN